MWGFFNQSFLPGDRFMPIPLGQLAKLAAELAKMFGIPFQVVWKIVLKYKNLPWGEIVRKVTKVLFGK